MRLILRAKGVAISSGETWHKDLVELSVSEKVVSQQLSGELQGYLAYRHFFAHSYSIMLREDKLMPLATQLSGVYERFISEIDAVLTGLPPH